MGKFYKSLLKGEIPYPTQKKFTLPAWDTYSEQVSQSDDDDQNIFAAGKWVFNKLEFIREQLEDLDFSQLQKEEALQCLVGFINRETLILNELQSKNKPKNETLTISHFNQKFKFNELSPELSLIDKFESTIEAIKYPIIQFLHSDKFSTKKDKSLNDQELLYSLSKAVNYSQYYIIIERIWSQCLWKKYTIKINENVDEIRIPVDDNDLKYEVVAKFRIDSLIFESTFYSIKLWKELLSEELKREIINIYIVKDIIGNGKSKRYILDKYLYDENSPPSSFITELHAQELYFSKLLEQSIPLVPAVTLRELFKVWHLLFSLADILKSRLPNDTEVLKISKLKMFSTSVKKNDLIKLITKAIKVNSADSKKILSIFTFLGNNDDELWTKPLIEYNERFYFAFGSILYPNLLRSLESWMKSGGFDLSNRGDLFEEFVRSEISDSIINSKLIKNAGVFPQHLLTTVEGRREEIDLVFWLGNKLIIGEIKCVLFPTSPLEEYRYNNRLIEAATQIKRKKNAVELNLQDIIRQLDLSGKLDSSQIEIIPIIITNLQLGSGKSIDSIPVTDLLLLNKYLRDGEMPLIVETSLNSEDKVHSIHKFYENEQEAYDNFTRFLNNPPLLSLYGSFLKKGSLQFPAGDESDKPYSKEYYEIIIE